MEEVAGDWRRIREELHNVYASPNVIRAIKSRRMRLVREVARMKEIRKAYNILVGKPEGRISHSWEDNIRKDLMERGWKVVNWMHLTQDREQWRALVNTVMKLRVHKGRGISRLAE